ncbi:MAG: hypothetical protein QM477_04770 [Planctomycetota bacterium]
MKRGIQAQLWNGRSFAPGWLTWKSGCFEEVSFQAPSSKQKALLHDLGQSCVLPGFVDTLLHGYAGVDCGDGSVKDLQRMSRALAATGVTSALAGFYPIDSSKLRSAAKRWGKWRQDRGTARTRFTGWHLEGPFLSPKLRGALPRKDLLKPSVAHAQKLIQACGGWLRVCTLAPEMKSIHEAVGVFHAARVLPSIGHTAATYADCEALASTGDCAITHMGNRLPPLSAREPGPIGFAMAGKASWVGVIPDLEHVAGETLRLWAKTAAMKNTLMATSDNLSFAGLPAESFSAGGKKLHRRGAVAVDAKDHLAGTLDALPEQLLHAHRCGFLSLPDVVRIGCRNPGSLIGDCGNLAVGERADFVILEDDQTIGPVWIGGRRVVGA